MSTIHSLTRTLTQVIHSPAQPLSDSLWHVCGDVSLERVWVGSVDLHSEGLVEATVEPRRTGHGEATGGHIEDGAFGRRLGLGCDIRRTHLT